MGNIVGEPIQSVIADQIDLRQKAHGSSYNSKSLNRTPDIQNYLNNRNSWIKLASGVELSKYERKENDKVIESYSGTQRLSELQQFSTDGYFTENDIKSLDGINLAKKYVLFNGTQEFDGTKFIPRSGVRKSNLWSPSQDKMYGGMGSNERGLQPVPGIVSVDVNTINRGSIKKATVKIKAYNKFQFGIIEILYLKLGFLVMLEYGWDKFIDSLDSTNTPIIKDVGSTIIENQWFKDKSFSQIEMLTEIQTLQSKYKGNYNGFFGKVSNFNWEMKEDNTYDITLNLISLGSVIESLQVSIPQNLNVLDKVSDSTEFAKLLTQQDTEGTGIFSIEASTNDEGEREDYNPNVIGDSMGTDKIHNFLVKSIFEMTKTDLDGTFDSKKFRFLDDIRVEGGSRKTGQEVPFKYKFTIRFGDFLNFLKKEIIGYVDNKNTSSPRLEIENSETTNVVNYTLNTVSLDPRICIFTPLIGDIEINEKIIFDSSGLFINTSKYDQYPGFKDMKQFAVKSNVNGILYGQLMNIYLNFQFISDCLTSNLDKENQLDLFKFLEAICDGINKAMGNSTKLAPAIKNQNQIYFVDENPITGWEEHAGLDTSLEYAKINLFGYNPNGTSNFVKDFGFQTKITPKLMNQISIGATAGGYDNATDAVGYKWWNRGLKNRFEDEYRVENNSNSNSKNKKQTTYQKRDELWEKAKTVPYLKRDEEFGAFGYKINYLNYTFKWRRNSNVDGNQVKRKYDDEENFKSYDLKTKVVDWMIDTENFIKVKAQPVSENPDIINIINYNGWVGKSFGYAEADMKTNNIPTSGDGGSKINLGKGYFNCNSDVLTAGANAFKSYLNSFNNILYKGFGINTGQTGFIPVDLSFTCEGISGIKIYNKLNINQKELPASYPKALKFVITGLQDTISNNTWESKLSTISQPPTAKSPKVAYNLKTPYVNVQTVDNVAGTGGNNTHTGPDSEKRSMILNYSLESSVNSGGLIYYPEETPKTQVVIHHTAGSSPVRQEIDRWRNIKGHISTHFIIQRDGTYDQLFPLKYWSNSIGIPKGQPGSKNNVNLQKQHISIELENLGFFQNKIVRDTPIEGSNRLERKIAYSRKNLTKLKEDLGEVVSPIGKEQYSIRYGIDNANIGSESVNKLVGNYWTCSNNWRGGNKNIITKYPTINSYRNYQYYQGYTPAQIETLFKVLNQISTEYPEIPIFYDYKDEQKKREQWANMFPPTNRVSKNAINFIPGLYTHNSYRKDKVDVVPQYILFEKLYNNGPVRSQDLYKKSKLYSWSKGYQSDPKIVFPSGYEKFQGWVNTSRGGR